MNMFAVLCSLALVASASADAGACSNAADKIISKDQVTIQAALMTCMLAAEDNVKATQECIMDVTTLSPSCGYCYAAEAMCVRSSCESTCGTNMFDEKCHSCMKKSCTPNFEKCSGLQNPPYFEDIAQATSTGACMNAADKSKAEQHKEMEAATAKCGLQCVGNEDCTANCVRTKTNVSETCAKCYGADAACSFKNCFLHCLDPFSKACQVCSYDKCSASLKQCSGVTPLNPNNETASPAGACMNAADKSKAEQHKEMEDTTAKCGLQCVGNEDCTANCVRTKTNVSETCAKCYGADAACSFKNCFLHCLNPLSKACQVCSYDNCGAALKECSGVTPLNPNKESVIVGATGQCTDSLDMSKMADKQAMETMVGQCATLCMGQTNCVQTCIENRAGITSGCAKCIGDDTQCGAEYCASQCSMNVNGADCRSCVDQYCSPAFYSCTGL